MQRLAETGNRTVYTLSVLQSAKSERQSGGERDTKKLPEETKAQTRKEEDPPQNPIKEIENPGKHRRDPPTGGNPQQLLEKIKSEKGGGKHQKPKHAVKEKIT